MSQSQKIVRSSPLVNIAAIAVIVASLTAIAGVTGMIPSAFSHKSDTPVRAEPAVGVLAAKDDVPTAQRSAAASQTCRQCGVIETIRQVHVKGQGTGLGAVAGGAAGAIVGSQFGRGNGRTAMGVVGAAGGAFAGHEIEKNVRSSTSHRVVVRMEDGTLRTVYQTAAPAFGVGEKVRVINGSLAARG